VKIFKTAESIGSKRWVRFTPGFYRWLKRRTSKVWRKAAKLDPENAPVRRPTKGWCD
jgi:hypothetical protein